MLVRRVNESFPVMRMRNEVDRLFENLFETFPPLEPLRGLGGYNFPAVNVWEDGDVIHVAAELPGITMEDIKVLVLGNELTIEGERKSEETREERGYHRQERRSGAFSRVFHLPVEVDAEKVEASLRDGVLSIKLPKARTAVPRKIEVKN